MVSCPTPATDPSKGSSNPVVCEFMAMAPSATLRPHILDDACTTNRRAPEHRQKVGARRLRMLPMRRGRIVAYEDKHARSAGPTDGPERCRAVIRALPLALAPGIRPTPTMTTMRPACY